jgi:hypothetical protein
LNPEALAAAVQFQVYFSSGLAIGVRLAETVAISPGPEYLRRNIDDVVAVEHIDADSAARKPYLLANPDLAELPIIV